MVADKTAADRPSTATLYAAIVAALKSAPDNIPAVNGHVMAKHALANLAALHASGINDGEKWETYREIVIALRERKPDTLRKPEPPPAGRVDVSKLAPVEIVTIKPEDVVDAKELPKVDDDEPEEEESEGDDGDNPAAELQRLLNRIVKPKTAPLNRRAVEDVVAKQFESYDRALKGALDALEAKIAKGGGTTRLEVHVGSEVNTVEGLTHFQLPQVITWANANVPLWLWGRAGAGKTHLFYQVAKALGLKPYVVSIDPTTTINKLLGYRNLATGEFVEGLIYKPYKEGGLFAPDELDTGDPGVIAGLNALLSNGHFMFPNGELVTRHEKFRVIVGANTKGTGAVAGYTARNRLDAATLDRFAVVEFVYDEGLELALTCGAPMLPTAWRAVKPATTEACRKYVEWVQKIRKAAGEAVLISPRASYHGVRALQAGIPAGEVLDALVFKLVAPDTKTRLVQQVGALPAL